MSEMDQSSVALARFYCQSYFSNLGREHTGSFLDLGHLASMLAAEGRSREVYQASRQLLAILDQTVIAERHGPRRPGSTGITLYFPNSTLYGAYDMLSGSVAYATSAASFASKSLWDEFLLSHYAGAPMPRAGAGSISFADQETTIVGPGVGRIEIAPIVASADVFSMDTPAFVSTEVSGGHIASVYLLRGLLVEEENAVLTLGRGHIQAEEDKEVNGVVYPDWASQTKNGVLTLEGNLLPEDLVISDGTSSVRALLWPEQYGGGGVYRVYGTHISTATGERRSAIMRFNLDSAEMLNMVVLTQEGGLTAPREYEPQPGDQFIVENTWIDLATGMQFRRDGDTVTFGEESVWLDTLPSVPGKYLLGVIVVDLDGNSYTRGIELTVEAD